MGQSYSIFNSSFPICDEKALIQDEITYPFQVNGKVRERFSISRNAGKEEIETLVRERFASYFEGKTVVKFIVVPGRIVNVVVK